MKHMVPKQKLIVLLISSLLLSITTIAQVDSIYLDCKDIKTIEGNHNTEFLDSYLNQVCFNHFSEVGGVYFLIDSVVSNGINIELFGEYYSSYYSDYIDYTTIYLLKTSSTFIIIPIADSVKTQLEEVGFREGHSQRLCLIEHWNLGYIKKIWLGKVENRIRKKGRMILQGGIITAGIE